MGGTLSAQNPIRIRLTEPQERLITSKAKHPAFVAGFGAGKSEVMTWAAIGDAAHSASALIGIYAPTYDLLRLNNAPRICAKLSELGVPHRWNKQENIVYTSYPRMGDFLMRPMLNPERIVAYETYRAHVDELDTLKAKQAEVAWNKILGRNRQKPDGVSNPFNRVSAYTTPEGFRFVYQRWKKAPAPGYEIIQAPTHSNPYLPEDYVQTLQGSYPNALLEAYIEGRFVNLTSGTIYRCYDRTRCNTEETMHPREALHIGQDFNVGKMASVVCVLRDGGALAVDELKGLQDTPHLIETLQERYPNRSITIYPDASGGSRKTVSASLSDISLLRSAGFKVRAPKQNPQVKNRILSVNNCLEKGILRVNYRMCPDLSEGLEQQAYDKNGEPDKSGGLDHHNDALGYLIHWHWPVDRAPIKTQSIW